MSTSETVGLSSQLSAATEPDTNAKSRGAVGTSSRRSTRIDANKRRAAMVDRVAKSVKRELKLLGSELQAWQQPKDPQQTARIQRECVKHFVTTQQQQRMREEAYPTAAAAAARLAKRLRNQSPCRPSVKPSRVNALSNIALRKARSALRARAASSPTPPLPQKGLRPHPPLRARDPP